MKQEQTVTPQLIDALDELAASGAHFPLERRLLDTAVWFHRNKPRLAKENVLGRLDFYEKTCDILIELAALACQRLQHVEGRPKSQSLWLPKGVEAKGSMKRFG